MMFLIFKLKFPLYSVQDVSKCTSSWLYIVCIIHRWQTLKANSNFLNLSIPVTDSNVKCDQPAVSC